MTTPETFMDNALASQGPFTGHYQPAASHLEQSLALSQQIGKPISQAYSLANLGIVDLRQGRYQQATDRLRQALDLSREFGDRSSPAKLIMNHGRHVEHVHNLFVIHRQSNM